MKLLERALSLGLARLLNGQEPVSGYAGDGALATKALMKSRSGNRRTQDTESAQADAWQTLVAEVDAWSGDSAIISMETPFSAR